MEAGRTRAGDAVANWLSSSRCDQVFDGPLPRHLLKGGAGGGGGRSTKCPGLQCCGELPIIRSCAQGGATRRDTTQLTDTLWAPRLRGCRGGHMDAITVAAAICAYHVVSAPHTKIGRSGKRGGRGHEEESLSPSLSQPSSPTTLCRPRRSPPVPSVRIRGVPRHFRRCHATRSRAGHLGNAVTLGTGAWKGLAGRTVGPTLFE